MSQLVRNFLRDEQRALKVLVDAAVAVIVLGFIAAVAAIVFMK